jgi:hypothetical protein
VNHEPLFAKSMERSMDKHSRLHIIHDVGGLNMSDVVLGDQNVAVIGDALDVTGHDLHLRDDARLAQAALHTNRRALVHDFQDGLTVNWSFDYPGGVTVFDLKAVPRPNIRDRRRRVKGGGAPPEPIHVAEAILALQEQVLALSDQLAALSARVP